MDSNTQKILNRRGWSKGLTKETDERIKRASEAKKGCIPWNKNKKGLQVAWNKNLTARTDDRIKKYVDKQKGQKRPTIKGDKNPSKRLEVRKKLRENNPMKKKENRDKVKKAKLELWANFVKRKKMIESMRGIPKTEIQKKNMSRIKIEFYKKHPEVKDILREKTIQQLSSGKMLCKDTKIERKVEKELRKRNIRYQKQVPLCKISIVDFFLPDSKIVIYCDGDYWHNLSGVQEKDKRQTEILIKNGYKVFRFYEHEINKSVKNCLDRIQF